MSEWTSTRHRMIQVGDSWVRADLIESISTVLGATVRGCTVRTIAGIRYEDTSTSAADMIDRWAGKEATS